MFQLWQYGWYGIVCQHWCLIGNSRLGMGREDPGMRAARTTTRLKSSFDSKLHPEKNKLNKTFSICPMHSCATIGFCEPQGLIGSGKTHIRTCVSIAQAQSKDAQESGVEVPTAISAFASLGSSGRHCSSEERDMHRWLGQLHGIQLQTYPVSMKLEVQNLVWPKIVTNLNALWKNAAISEQSGFQQCGCGRNFCTDTPATRSATCPCYGWPRTGEPTYLKCIVQWNYHPIVWHWVLLHCLASSPNLCLGDAVKKHSNSFGITAYSCRIRKTTLRLLGGKHQSPVISSGLSSAISLCSLPCMCIYKFTYIYIHIQICLLYRRHFSPSNPRHTAADPSRGWLRDLSERRVYSVELV